ncbi:methyltransferase domain-containing protein [Cryomorphaceae bacterium 1068]|nr:methyltransferase domain-containing protein [Cryomorphaceae bacterium 1068]
MKEMWDNRYSAATYAYGKAPNDFFKTSLEKYRPKGRILMPAEGEGRNGVYAAKLGLEVTAFDISVEGRNKALQLAQAEKVSIDYLVGDFMEMDFPDNHFDAAALIYAHFPRHLLSEYHKTIARLMEPNGLVILEGFSKSNLPLREKNPGIGGPAKKEMLFSEESIIRDFPNFEVLELAEVETDLSEGEYHNGIAKVIRFVGRKTM